MIISAKELEAQKDNFCILDIRTPREVDEKNMGGIAIPLEELLLRIKEIEHLKKEKIVVICYSGWQSAIALKILQKTGFEKAYHLEGGLETYWEENRK